MFIKCTNFNENPERRICVYLYAMKKVSLYIMSVFYIGAGINHFLHEEMYMKIMPPWLPFPDALVYTSGVCETIFGMLLLFPRTRSFAAWCIILLLIFIFPANIQMMLNYMHESNPGLWATIVRLPLQIVLIWWAYLFTKKKQQK
jgi:uncharacterized membrane protein